MIEYNVGDHVTVSSRALSWSTTGGRGILSWISECGTICVVDLQKNGKTYGTVSNLHTSFVTKIRPRVFKNETFVRRMLGVN